MVSAHLAYHLAKLVQAALNALPAEKDSTLLEPHTTVHLAPQGAKGATLLQIVRSVNLVFTRMQECVLQLTQMLLAF